MCWKGRGASDALHRAESLAEEGWEHVADTAHDLGDRARGAAGRAAGRATELGGAAVESARGRLRDWAGQAQDAGDRVAARARSARRQASSYASDAYEHVNDSAEEYGARAGRLGRRVVEGARGLAGGAAARGQDAARRAGSWLGYAGDEARDAIEPSTPVMPAVLTGIGCLALGFGVMYLIDPERGRARRAYILNRLAGTANRTGRAVRDRGTHLANQARGAVAETRARFSSEIVSGEQLLQRVRSELGHVTSQPRLIQVSTDSAGTVTLTGPVLASENASVLATVRAIPGVREVIDRMDVRESIPQTAPAGGAGA